jgi:hypothetical protein
VESLTHWPSGPHLNLYRCFIAGSVKGLVQSHVLSNRVQACGPLTNHLPTPRRPPALNENYWLAASCGSNEIMYSCQAYIYIYIYIYREREREGEREQGWSDKNALGAEMVVARHENFLALYVVASPDVQSHNIGIAYTWSHAYIGWYLHACVYACFYNMMLCFNLLTRKYIVYDFPRL